MGMLGAAVTGALFGAVTAAVLRFAGATPVWWQVALAMAVVASLAQEPAQRMIGGGRLDNRPALRTALAMGQFAVLFDLGGLGFVLPVCGVTVAAVHIQWSGSAAWRPIRSTVTAATVVNCLPLALGVGPSIVQPRMGVTLSLLLLTVALLAIANVGLTTAARERVTARLSHVASHDSLTGLMNREAFYQQVTAAMTRVSSERPAALLFCDLDGFKAVNDTMGHDGGDQVLVTVAARLRTTCRTQDLVARMGGDEFTLFLPAIFEPDAHALADRVRSVIAEPVANRGGQPARVGISVGIVMVERDDADVDDVFQRADDAMYAAKRAARGQSLGSTGSDSSASTPKTA